MRTTLTHFFSRKISCKKFFFIFYITILSLSSACKPASKEQIALQIADTKGKILLNNRLFQRKDMFINDNLQTKKNSYALLRKPGLRVNIVIFPETTLWLKSISQKKNKTGLMEIFVDRGRILILKEAEKNLFIKLESRIFIAEERKAGAMFATIDRLNASLFLAKGEAKLKLAQRINFDRFQELILEAGSKTAIHVDKIGIPTEMQKSTLLQIQQAGKSLTDKSSLSDLEILQKLIKI